MRLRILLLLTSLIGLIFFFGCSKNDNKITIGITTIIEQPALVEARQGFEQVLSENGYSSEKVNIIYENAQGDIGRANQIAAKFVGTKVNLIYAIATPSAIAVAQRTQEIPIVFGAVTDPVGAELVESWENPGGNVTGVSDLLNAELQFNFFKNVLPEMKKVGIVYNPGEPSASSTVSLLKINAEKYGYTIVESPAYKSADVNAAAVNLLGKADFIYIVPDNTIGAALEVLSTVSRDNGIPLLSCEMGAVKDGFAIAALSFDYYKIGQMAGEIALEILKGKSPSQIPVQSISEPKIIINEENSKSLDITYPLETIEKAEII